MFVMPQKLPACQGHYSKFFTFKGFVSRYTFPTGHPSEKKSEDKLKVNCINQIYPANFDVEAKGSGYSVNEKWGGLNISR